MYFNLMLAKAKKKTILLWNIKEEISISKITQNTKHGWNIKEDILIS
jgi:hypothetical protein